ncbi:MAG: hypothetical protein R3Y21_03875 [Mycoplasmatota bacterium]
MGSKEKNIKNEIYDKTEPENIDNLSETLRKFADLNLTIQNSIDVTAFSNMFPNFQPIIDSMMEANKVLTKYILDDSNSLINNIISSIDFSAFDDIYKDIAIIYLINGFYPYRKSYIDFEKLLNSKNPKNCLSKLVKIDIIEKKQEILNFFSKHERIINEVYSLYEKKEYRLCVLSLINIISIISNEKYNKVDFIDRKGIRKRLFENNVMEENEKNYLLLSPYIDEEIFVKSNKILVSYRNTPEDYKKIPYNRHAILHGYSQNFGNEINCLRYFSILINTFEILEKISETKTNEK